LQYYQYLFIKFPAGEADDELPRLASRSWRKVSNSGLVDVPPVPLVVLPVVLLDALPVVLLLVLPDVPLVLPDVLVVLLDELVTEAA
jgi:hypothetical protein